MVALSITLAFLLAPKPEGRLDNKLLLTDLSPSYEIIPFDEGCAYIDNEKGELYYQDSDGYVMWGYSGTTDQMKTRASTGRLAVYASSKLQMISSSGEFLYSKVYDYPIQDLRISDNLCIMLQIHGAKNYLNVIDSQGEIIDTIEQKENEIFLSYGIFTTDNSSVYIITANTSGISPIYRFTTYRYQDQKHITVSYSEYNQIIYNPVFQSDKISLMGSHEIINIDYSGKTLSRTRCIGYESKENNYSNNSNVLILSSVSQNPDADKKLLCILNTGVSYFIEEDYKIIASAITKKYLYVFTEHYLYTYDINSLYKVTYPMPQNIKNVFVNGNTAYITGKDVFRLELE